MEKQMLKILYLLVFFSLFINISDCGWRRRRRRSCGAVNCRWGAWSAWSACTAPCGNSGTKTHTRSVAVSASCGGSGCSGSGSETTSCNRFCYNSGTARATSCSCPNEYWGRCCEHDCTVIANCESLVCTSASNQQCHKCIYDRGGEKKAYQLMNSGGYSNRICEQRCSWRPDSKFCYPGICPGTPSTCSCAPNYSGTNCLTISKNPTMNFCLVALVRSSDDTKVEADCDDHVTAPATVYLNMQIDRVDAKWDTSFVGPDASSYPWPYYINDFEVGIIGASFEWKVMRGNIVVNNGGSVSCNNGYSQNNPNHAMHNCDKNSSFSFAFQHNDRLYVTIKSQNGGFVKLNNYDNVLSVSVGSSKYYTGKTLTHATDFTFDFESPYHCSNSSACTENILYIGEAYKREESFKIEWSGWNDDLSGITGYTSKIKKMNYYGEILDYGDLVTKENLENTANHTFVSLANQGAGMYCAILTAIDGAGNHKIARRFFMYDNSTNVDIGSDNLWIDSASTNTSREWQTNVNTQVIIKWPGHFLNRYHREHKLLNSIRDHVPAGEISAGYEERTGQPPSTRSMEAIPNINAIVRFERKYAVDHEGGRSITENSGVWQDVANLMTESESIGLSMQDGDFVKVWIRATDVMRNTAQDSVSVYIDSSPPVLENIWLQKNGVNQLAVHDSIDLYNMKTVFQSFDDHSGLHSIHWTLYDMETLAVFGQGQIAVRKTMEDNCDLPNCACIPKDEECYYRDYSIVLDGSKMNVSTGTHDHDYIFQITSTNNAMLQTAKRFQITVDISPPEKGHVLDSLEGETDIDYQQETAIHAHWSGFFDRESGVLFYSYIFNTDCTSADNFTVPVKLPIANTTSPYATWEAPGKGTYYCTVVAYNRAMEPSEPVCSDGVTIDDSEPIVSDVVVVGSVTAGGIAKDSDDNVWMISSTRYRYPIIQPSQECVEKADLIIDIQQWPIGSNGINFTSSDCLEANNHSPFSYITSENLLLVEWSCYDQESGILDYEVGISSTDSGLDPDILPYTSTNGHNEFRTYHPDLAEGLSFYIMIRVTNKANIQVTKVIGSFIVDTTPPQFDREIIMSYERVDDMNFLVARWSLDAFWEDEDQDRLFYEVAIGSIEETSNILNFLPLSEFQFGVCSNRTDEMCAAVAVDTLNWNLHGNHLYHFTVRVTNAAGLSITESSLPYTHVTSLPYEGYIFEISPDPNVNGDIDHQTSSSELKCAWYGFSHPHLEVNLKLGLGSSPGQDDTVSFFYVVSVYEYTFTNLNLENYKRYYITVLASNEVGYVNVSSDGVTVLPDGGLLNDFVTILDGPGCSDQVNTSDTLKFYHHEHFVEFCEEDLEYQPSLSSVKCHWDIREDYSLYITHIEWALEMEEKNEGENSWDLLFEYKSFNMTDKIHSVGLELNPGGHYRSSVKFCYSAGCFEPVSSNGFHVITTPPVSNGIQKIDYNETSGELSFTWEKFINMEKDQVDLVDFCEWTLIVDKKDSNYGELISPWRRLEDVTTTPIIKTYIHLEEKLVFTECIQLGVRCYNKVGLYTDIYKNVQDCSIFGNVIPNDVIDAVGVWDGKNEECSNIVLETNGLWEAPDMEYTRCSNQLSAVWPNLRQGFYKWLVIQNDELQAFAYVYNEESNSIKDYATSHPAVLKFGETTNNFINIDGFSLQHGKRYYICVHANETTLNFEKSSIHLSAVSACSNGIVVDQTPPLAGKVWLGFDENFYQTTTSELHIRWETFIDVEEHGKTSHSSGIQSYQYAIGTYPNGNDVVDFTSVGITNQVVVTGLTLQSGINYFATVRATDYVGLSAVSTSPGITIDTSPPLLSSASIDVGGKYHKSTSEISASWRRLFSDPESGIDHYEWGVGTFAGYTDVMPFESISTEESTSPENVDLAMEEGHVYFVSVRAYNGAGLSSLAVSWPFVVDVSPPIKGEVLDGFGSTDQDYQTDMESLGAHWKGFADPHTAIVDYSTSIGTCKGCDDVLVVQHVGLLTRVSVSHLNLQPTHIYYVTVTACNVADLCTSVISDGIIPDNSPPITGPVYDGAMGEDVQYQASRTSIAAHWLNFHDSHSQISHYEWFAGTSPGSDDVMPKKSLHLTNVAFVSQLSNLLPFNTRIYVTVRAYNKAGLSAERSSNGFVVDESPPIVIQPAVFDQSKGSAVNNTQIWRTTLTVTWEFSDDESPIHEYLISIMTHHNSDNQIDTVKIAGQVEGYTFSGLNLADGETYYAKVIACNAARLCSETESEGLLVDSTPPTVGTFASESDHASLLGREISGWMTYSQSQNNKKAQVKLSWLGFADPHSGVGHYFLTVGSEFAGTQLTPDGPVMRSHDSNSLYNLDEGLVQTAVIDIDRNLVSGEHIYVTMWGVNGVGLRSYEAHVTFEVVSSNDRKGILSLLRRCDTQSCLGHCTCAPQNQVCSNSAESCFEVTGNTSYQDVYVMDIINYRIFENWAKNSWQDVDYTPAQCSLAAAWTLGEENAIMVKRFEWSAGIKGMPPGTGVLDLVNDQIWHEIGLEKEAILALEREENSDEYLLSPYVEYVFYVRAWYDDKTYAIFHSDGIMTDYTPPDISNIRKVKDVVNGSVDVDYLDQRNTVSIYWKNVFSDGELDIAYYQAALGTIAGVPDVANYTKISANEYVTTFDGLKLLSGHKYYAIINAINHAGMQATTSSDGFIVDVKRPVSGIVYDGIGLHDVSYQSSTSTISATWYGFTDVESGIDHYTWCVGSSAGGEDLVSCRNMGLRTSVSLNLNNEFNNGDKYYSKVYAVDAAGWDSESVVSDGVVVDTTPPIPTENIHYSDNIISSNNPSFEYNLQTEGLKTPQYWTVNYGTAEVTTTSNSQVAKDGSSFLQLYGSISQNISTAIGQRYRLTFHTSHMYEDNIPVWSQEGVVVVPGLHQVFQLYQRPKRFDNAHYLTNNSIVWHKKVYYFTADEILSTISFSSVGNKSGLLLDDISIDAMTTGETNTGAIHIQTVQIFDWHSVHASWSFEDFESPIVDYLWAIGTVEGGTQIQGYTSVGRKDYAENNQLLLVHGINIHVTVLALNAAGLTAIVHSEPFIVDLTPPQLCCLKDGLSDEDIQYQSSKIILVQFVVTETDSALDYCEWAIGLSPGSEELQSFVKLNGVSNGTADLSHVLNHGQKVYSTIKCHNTLGMSSQAISDGVIIVTGPPEVKDASLRFVSSSPSYFPASNNYQADNSSLSFIWEGFYDESGIKHYEFFMEGPDKQSEWLPVGFHGEKFVKLTGLELLPRKAYTVQLRAVNNAGFISQAIHTNITIESLPPTLIESNIRMDWNNNETLTIDWKDAFSSFSSLFYEVRVGSIATGSGVIQLMETIGTSLTVTNLNGGVEHYVTITAVNSAGLYTNFHTYTSL